jgi:subtilisin family serine protease
MARRRPSRLSLATAISAVAMAFVSTAARAAPVRGFAPGAVHLESRFLGVFSGGARRHPFADSTGRLPLVIRLSAEQPMTSSWLPLGAGFATVRVAPSDLAKFEADHPGVRYSISPPLHALLDESTRLNGTRDYRAALAAAGSSLTGTGKGVIVGVIDTGIDGRHADFIDAAGHTRIAWWLDLSHDAVGIHSDVESAFGCTTSAQSPCAVLNGDDIDAALLGNGMGYVPRDLVGHGTHVASIAAGNDPSGRFVGGAPDAQLIVAAVTSGAAGLVTDANIALGAKFIFDRADAMGLPAVVNLSLGGDFGPHDGSTALEQSLAEMVGPAHAGHAIIVAAGNSGTLFQGRTAAEVLGIHTELRVTPDAPARAPILSPGQSVDANLTGNVLLWITYGSSDRMSVGVTGPNGIFVAPQAAGHTASYAASDASFTVAVFNGVEQDPQASLSDQAHGAVVAWTGRWPAASEFNLDFQGDGLAEAWVTTELDNGDPSPEMFEHALLQGTVSLPATHPDLISVGCTINRTTWTDATHQSYGVEALEGLGSNVTTDSTCVFSSAGPNSNGVIKPEISAPGALVAAAMSQDAAPAAGRASIFDAPLGVCANDNPCFVVDATHALLSGSSMSAPQVTGAVALLFERDPTLAQPDIARALQQGARRPAGNVFADYQLGNGALDVRGAVAALAVGAASGVPEPAQSWLSLSGGFVHPDLGEPVTGTIELRSNDGAIADDFDASRLSVEVSGAAAITSPLSRVASGLWRFEMSGQPGSGQDVMEVGARFDGVPIGQSDKLYGLRALPVGGDRWIAVQSASAHGGCAMSPRAAGAAGADGARAPSLLAWMAAAYAFRRTARSGTARRSRTAPRREAHSAETVSK